MRNHVTLLVAIFFIGITNAQEKATISGIITDAHSGEFLIGANVYITSIDQGTSTNNYGFYSITLDAVDSVGIAVSYLGYQGQIKKIFLQKNFRLDISLSPEVRFLEEVVVRSGQNDDNISRPQMSVVDIPTSKIQELPVILGEADVLKVLQLLPGVQQGNEGTAGFHVRGGNTDQNLVLLDEAIVYNPNHLLGLFSVFNTRAINNVKLIKGGFSAQYGGRLSSILDINLKEGNKKKFGMEGGIGLVSTQLTAEGPIVKDKASFIISGRRTYFDYLIKPILPGNVSTNYAFYDINAKLNWELGKKDQIFLSYFKARDIADYSQDGIKYDIFLANEAITFRWNHIFGPKLFLNTSLIKNEYDQDISALQDNVNSNVISSIEDLSAKMEFQYYPGIHHKIRTGVQFFDHTFRSSGDSQIQSISDQTSGIPIDSIPVKKFDEFNIYVNDEIEISKSISANLGIRVPVFLSSDINYFKVEPRASVRFGLNETTSLKVSYAAMNQFIHLIPSSTAAVPTDIWVPSTNRTKPQYSQQYSLGIFKNFQNNKWESSLEAYYKTMDNQILFEEGNQLIRSLDIDDLLVYGEGWSYGAELFLKKKFGRLTGWGGYTLSWTYQKFPELNFGNKFPFRHDRRHDFSLAATYELNEKWTASASFVFSSGSTYTVPVGRFNVIQSGSLFEGNYYIYEERNNARLNPYHRLNVSFTYKKERTLLKKKYMSELIIGFYNLYNRQNPYFIYFDIDPQTEEPRARQVSLLPIIPNISYNFKF
jgi:hypothetical protein